MSYVKSSLMPGEDIIYMGKVHWFVYVRPMLWSCVFFYLISLMGQSATAHIAETEAANAMIPIALTITFFVTLFSWLRAIGLHLGTEYGVTTKRVILKRGFIMRKTAELMLAKLEGLGVEQSIMGRIFGFGTLTVGGTGGVGTGFAFCIKPVEFRRQVAMQADKFNSSRDN
jgi:uncharacterized membrane protein YdbT with pleckstrin-like domain